MRMETIKMKKLILIAVIAVTMFSSSMCEAHGRGGFNRFRGRNNFFFVPPRPVFVAPQPFFVPQPFIAPQPFFGGYGGFNQFNGNGGCQSFFGGY